MKVNINKVVHSAITPTCVRASVCTIIAIVIPLALDSCVTMSSAECQYQDWNAKGLVDGMQGKTMEQYLRYVRACDKHGFLPNREDYMKGREQGLQHFCTRENGFEYGEGGRDYAGVCPADIEHRFLSAYNVGREMFDAWDEVRYIESVISSNERQIARLDDEVQDLEKEIVDSKEDATSRQKKLDQIKRRAATIGALTQEIYEQQSKRAAAINRCVEVRQRVIEQGFSTTKRCHF